MTANNPLSYYYCSNRLHLNTPLPLPCSRAETPTPFFGVLRKSAPPSRNLSDLRHRKSQTAARLVHGKQLAASGESHWQCRGYKGCCLLFFKLYSCCDRYVDQMPIKPFKGFARRKSSGNALEEVENPPQSSFRVFERPSTGRKSLSDGNLLSGRTGDGSHAYSPPEDDNIFAGSHGPAYRDLYQPLALSYSVHYSKARC